MFRLGWQKRSTAIPMAARVNPLQQNNNAEVWSSSFNWLRLTTADTYLPNGFSIERISYKRAMIHTGSPDQRASNVYSSQYLTRLLISRVQGSGVGRSFSIAQNLDMIANEISQWCRWLGNLNLVLLDKSYASHGTTHSMQWNGGHNTKTQRLWQSRRTILGDHGTASFDGIVAPAVFEDGAVHITINWRLDEPLSMRLPVEAFIFIVQGVIFRIVGDAKLSARLFVKVATDFLVGCSDFTLGSGCLLLSTISASLTLLGSSCRFLCNSCCISTLCSRSFNATDYLSYCKIDDNSEKSS